jgi:hypothetical protein
MTEADTFAYTAILIEELRECTTRMIDAGSLALTRLRDKPMTKESERLTAIWRAMLAAKLGEPR